MIDDSDCEGEADSDSDGRDDSDRDGEVHRDMTTIPTEEQLHGFDTSPTILKALLLFFENSGLAEYREVDSLTEVDDMAIMHKPEWTDADIVALPAEVRALVDKIKRNTVTPEDAKRLVTAFKGRFAESNAIVACAVCGERNLALEDSVDVYTIDDDLFIPLELSEEQVRDYLALGRYMPARAVVQQEDGTYMYLHPKLVIDGSSIIPCSSCVYHLKRKAVPKFCVASG
jgi:hypothetical protein